MKTIMVRVDAAALDAAAAVLGTSTRAETINRALADIAGRPERLAFLEHLRRTPDDLGDRSVMEGAWRQPSCSS
ncbi:MAG: hypothetical protein Q7T71_11850 [Herbiconiux sp.]|nr:hypothetical protein [Herbiconiux sp.]